MNKEININVRVNKNKKEVSIPLTLRLKIFSKNEEMIYVWKTSDTEDLFLAIIYNSNNYIYPDNIKKDLRILTSKEEIIEQVVEKTPIF
jgi:hypothetical protein